MAHLSDIAKQILEDPYFIGASNLLDKLDWEPGDGIQAKNIDYLIVKRTPDDDPDACSQLATLLAVGRISEERCKLLPCGGWTDTFGGNLGDAKASFILVQPRHHDLLPLWGPVVAAINSLQDSKRSLNAQRQNEIIADLENSTGKGLKLRHKLFEASTTSLLYALKTLTSFPVSMFRQAVEPPAENLEDVDTQDTGLQAGSSAEEASDASNNSPTTLASDTTSEYVTVGLPGEQ